MERLVAEATEDEDDPNFEPGEEEEEEVSIAEFDKKEGWGVISANDVQISVHSQIIQKSFNTLKAMPATCALTCHWTYRSLSGTVQRPQIRLSRKPLPSRSRFGH
jgi:hypothetical protein